MTYLSDTLVASTDSLATSPTMRPELRNRLIYGFTIAGCAIAAVVHDLMRDSHWGVMALGIIAGITGSIEFTRLARAHASHARLAPLVVIVVSLVVVAHAHNLFPDHFHTTLASLPVIALIFGFGLLWTIMAQMFRYATENFFANVGSTLFGMVYLGVAMHMLQQLSLLETPDNSGRGVQLLLLFLAAVKLGDVSAYFGGRALGRHKMSPRISPGKTWEGFFCSFVGSIGGTYLFLWLLHITSGMNPFAGWWQPVVWAIVLGPLGVAGDLAESAMKRDAAVKDSGDAVPGFGGFLDILDATILAAPIAFLLALVL